MPNIKIYGVIQNLNNDQQLRKIAEISAKIKQLFKDTSWFDHTVITYVPSIVGDLKMDNQPYIQLELDCMKNYEKKVELLKTLGYDIQVVKLYAFIPKSK